MSECHFYPEHWFDADFILSPFQFKMTVGSIIHELLQIVLQRRLTTLAEIRAVTDELLMSQQMAFTLFASQMTAADAYEEINKFQEKIVDFVDKYLTECRAVDGKKVGAVWGLRQFRCTVQHILDTNKYIFIFQDGLFEGQIDNIQDIEENIWIPQMGLKGKVDASVNVRLRGKKGKWASSRNLSMACGQWSCIGIYSHSSPLRAAQIHAARVENRPRQFLVGAQRPADYLPNDDVRGGRSSGLGSASLLARGCDERDPGLA